MKEKLPPMDLDRMLQMRDISQQLENKMRCGVCGNADCYTFIVKEGEGLLKVYHQRGAIFLCKKCYKDSIFWDNLLWRIIKPLLKIKRKLGL